MLHGAEGTGHPMGNEEDVLGGGEEGKLLKTPFVDKEPQ